MVKANIQTKKKTLKSQLMSAISMLLIAAVALTSATYAWFTFVSNPEIQLLDVYVKAADNIFLSPLSMLEMDKDNALRDDPRLWFPTLLKYTDATLVNDRPFTLTPESTNATNGIQDWQAAAFPVQLSDVSSLFSEVSSDFFARENNDYGQFKFYKPAIEPIWKDGAPTGDYVKFEVWIKSSADGAIFLDAKDSQGNLRTFVKPINVDGKDLDPTNVKAGIIHTVRVGFHVPKDGSNNERFVIWEPNSDKHVAIANEGPGNEFGRLDTNAIIANDPVICNKTHGFVLDAEGKPTEELIPCSLTIEACDGAVHKQNLYDFGFRTNVTHSNYNDVKDNRILLFDLKKDAPIKFTIYIWVEGADADTVNDVAKSYFQTQLRFEQWKSSLTIEQITQGILTGGTEETTSEPTSEP